MKNKLSKVFYGMKKRCYDTTNPNYKYYGGRGVIICSEWNDSEIIKTETGRATKGWLAFKKWALESGYQENLQIDRINVNGNYEPSNCRWITHKEQCNNRRSNRIITYKGKTQNLKKWCEELSLKYKLIEDRLNRYHWSIERAFEN